MKRVMLILATLALLLAARNKAKADIITFNNVVDNTTSAPGHGPFNVLYSPSVSGNNVAFNGFYTGGGGIYTGSVGTTGANKIVDTTDAAPGHGVFTNFTQLASNGSNVAFTGLYGGGSGIDTGSVGTIGASKIVDTTDAASGHGTFTSFGNAVVGGSNVAFAGLYSGGSGI